MLVVDFDAPDRLRAFARYDAGRLATVPAATPADLLGSGHLALTIDQGSEASRYQGIVALEGQGLEAAAHQYFRRSEQIPTFVRLAVAQNITGAGANWRAGGLIAQFLPASAARRRQSDLDPGDAPPGLSASADVPRRRCLGRGQGARRDARGSRTRRSDLVERAAALSPVSRAGRARLRRRSRCAMPAAVRANVSLPCCAASHARSGPTWSARMARIGVTCEFCSAYRAFDPAGFDPQ